MAIRAELERPAGTPSGSLAVFSADDVGFFYLIQLEPVHDPRRFKLGFTRDLDGRLQKHRCSAPFAQYTGSWPCKRVLERAAIGCVTSGCEQLHTEVLRSASLVQIADHPKTFFSMMPNPEADSGDDEQMETDEKVGKAAAVSRR